MTEAVVAWLMHDLEILGESMIQNLTDEQIDLRLTMMEEASAHADALDLPCLNNTIQRLMDEQVRRDLLREEQNGL